MQQNYPFQPRGANQISAVSTNSGAVTASATQITLPQTAAEGGTMRLVNSGPNTVFFLYGNVAVTASGTAMGVPLLPNSAESFSLPGNVTQISVIAATTGNTLYVTMGDGI